MTGGSTDVSLLGKIAGFTEILNKDPHSTVFVPLSEAYRSMGMLDDALEVARRGIAAVPAYAPGYITLARSLAERGRLAESADAFGEALRLEEGNLQALKGLARVRQMQGQSEQARTLLTQASQLAPEDAAVGKMLASLGAPPAQTAQPAQTPSPSAKREVPIATMTVAEIYERQGLYRKAYNVYYDLYRTSPDNALLRQKLSELKGLIESGASPSAPPAPVAAEAAPTPVAEPAASSPVEPPQDTADASHQQLMAIFTRWLEAIQRRRSHV